MTRCNQKQTGRLKNRCSRNKKKYLSVEFLKTSRGWLNRKLDKDEERINKLEDMSTVITPNATQSDKNLKYEGFDEIYEE